MSTSVNIVSGLGIPSQIPLNPKQNSASEATLKDLGLNDNLAFTYEKGLQVYCRLEGTRYEWREVLSGEELTGLRDTDFIYPDGTITDNVDYSNKKYNFFPIISTITPSEVYIEQGDNIIITGTGIELDPLIINGLSSPLNQLDEGNGNGIIIRNRTSINYGNIGLNAVDFSYNNVSSSTKGATGLSSFSINKSNTSSGENSFTGGLNNIASNLNSFSFGENNESNNINTISLGSNIISSGISAIGIGKGLNSKSFLETVLGSYNSNYTPISTSTWSTTDRLFTIGNGFNEFNKSDALLIYKNGLALLPSVTNSLIENATGKAIVTREYLESILPTTVDGSETKLLAGTNITITGNGTTPTPYIISYDADDISQYTDEMARDAIGTILEDTNTITFNYDDVLETIEANVNINGSSTSTGILSGGGLSIGTLNTLWTIQAGSGYIYNSLTNTSQPITWLTQEDNIATYLTTNISTYILVDNTGIIIQQTTAPTQQQLRTHIYIGKLAHTTLSTILFTVTEPCRMFDISSQIADLNKAIGPVNVGGGNVINHNGSNLTISATEGGTYRPGANYLTDRNSPSITSEPQVSAPTFRRKYRTGTGTWNAVNATTIDPDKYDNNSGTLVTVPTGKFTVQVFWRFGNTGTIHVDYGQTYYDTLEQARASIGGAVVIQDPDNVRDAVKRGWLIVKQNTNVLNNSSDAVFIQADKFGERGATGIIPDLQSTYNNSSSPEILTNTTLGAFSLKRGSTADTDNVFEIINGAGSITSTIKGNGNLTAGIINSGNIFAGEISGSYFRPSVGVEMPNGGYIAVDGDGTNYFKGFRDDRWVSDIKIKYLTDLSGSYDSRTLIDKGYLDTRLGSTSTGFELLSNKATDFTTVNNTLYPSVQAVKTYADGKQNDLEVINVKDFGAVGDGVADDTSSILSAINAADAAGGRIVFFPIGTYIVSHIYLNGKENITLTSPKGTIIKKKVGTGYNVNIDGAISGVIDFVDCNNIKVTNIEFNGDKLNATPAAGTHLNGINFYNTDNVLVENCVFRNVEFQGCNAQISDNIKINNCDFYDCGWSGVGITGGYFSTYGAKYAWVTNCLFSNIWAGIQSQISMEHLHLEGNHFRNSSIILAQDVSYFNIKNNTFYGAAPSGALGELGQDAITIESDSNGTIEGNSITAPARHGIYVVGNYVENGPREGILTCDNITVKNNIISDCAANGIEFDSGSVFTYNIVTHTATPAVEANYTYGINGIIEGNILKNNGGAGLVTGVVENLKVVNNLINFNTTHGWVVNSCKQIDGHSNRISNNSQAGVDVYNGISINTTQTTLQNITLIDNEVYDDQVVRTQAYGFFNSNTNVAFIRMRDNIFRGNGTDYSNAVATVPYNYESTTIGSGAAFSALNPGSGTGYIANTTGSGYNFVGQNSGVDTFQVNKIGDLWSSGFISSGGAVASTYPLYVRTATDSNFRMVQDGGVAQLSCVDNAISAHVGFKLGNGWLNFTSGGAASFSSTLSATSYTGDATLTGTPTAPTAAPGTNTTQIATTAFVQAASRPYKIYFALLTQTSTGAPVATVLENTLGGTVVWTRTSTGIYVGTLSGAFTTNKTSATITNGSTGAKIIGAYADTVNTITVGTVSALTSAVEDDVLFVAPIEIRVYP